MSLDTVPDLTGEIPVLHIARVPRADVVQVRREPLMPAPISASGHVCLVAPRRHSRLFYITRFAARSAMWALIGAGAMFGIWGCIWAVYAVWVTR